MPLWFTEGQTNKIGRITTSGVITEYPLPDPMSIPYAITAGPDGALWFTEFGNGKIGRITTAGVITEFVLPTGNEPDGLYHNNKDGTFTRVTSGAIATARTSISRRAVALPAALRAVTT